MVAFLGFLAHEISAAVFSVAAVAAVAAAASFDVVDAGDAERGAPGFIPSLSAICSIRKPF